ncbi:MAG: hypothetical protein LC800_05510 [Acidobacteria bacterium]|nr:hypothetical protein [Acidobacteriota bacterium]
MAKLTSQVWHARELAVMQQRSPEHFLTLAAPVQRRVLAGGLTIHHQVQQSLLPAAAMTKTMRQALRPRARVAHLVGLDARHNAGNLLERMNRGEVSAAPPKVVAPILPTEEELADQFAPSGLPAPWLDLLRRHPWLRFLPLAFALLIFILFLLTATLSLALVVGVVLAAGAVALALWLGRQLNAARAADVLRPDTRTPESVDQLPSSPDFRVGTPRPDAPAPTLGATDSPEAARFKESLRNLYAVDVAERAVKIRVRRPLDLAPLMAAALDGLQPARTIPARLFGSLLIPPRIREQMIEEFDEVMAYPEIDVPMYEPLKELSSELFLPNIQLIQNNSITLLETNQKFIESYMVGLNHEFARELLWREFPTDQRGSYFRQFWDARGFLAPGSDTAALRERLRDIPELHLWPKQSGLDEHDHREAQGDKEDELVLVIRGELLKKYPTAVIYAHRAAWERTAEGRIDKTRPRALAPLTPSEELNPPRDKVKTPLYEAQVAPDIYFFGFDLTSAKARGGEIVGGEPDPGWFFVIQERPGEPRFGLDLPKPAPQTAINTWNDLAWTDVLNAYTPGAFLRTGERAVTLTNPGSADPARQQQYGEDSRFRWRADTHAAELAYILYQVPVLMAVHAAEMLKKPE